MVMLFATGSDSMILRPVWMYLVCLRDVVACDRCWYLVAPPSVFWRIGSELCVQALVNWCVFRKKNLCDDGW